MPPLSRIIAGIDASTITSLGTCRLVMPLSELTIASAGRCAYSAAMSASIPARCASGSWPSLAYRSPMPLLGSKPISAMVRGCFSSTGA